MYYTPYNPQYNPMFVQPQPQQIQQPQTLQPAQNNGPIWVQGETGAKSYLIAPGTTVMLMDSEENRFFLKSSDASGMPQPLRVFAYTEITPETAARTPQNDAKAPQGDYITRDEFNGLCARVESLAAKPSKKVKARQEESEGWDDAE